MSPLTTLAPDEQATWFPDCLVELTLPGGGTTRRYAYGGDLDQLDTAYDGRLLSPPTIQRSLTDALWGVVALQDATIELANADGALTDDYRDGYQTAGVAIKRYDRVSGFLATEFTGLVSRAALGRGLVRLECQSVDKAALEDLIPKGLVDTATWPEAKDVGAVIPVVLGNVPRVPCPNVQDDVVNSHFDYLIGHGSVAVTALYRNGQNDSLHSIGFAECVRAAGGAATSWSEVARTDLYPGYTVVRFALRQADFNNSLHRIYADVTGLAAERNFAIAAKTLLSDAAWGLGRAVNAASFAAAAAALHVNLLCDGAMLEQRQARDWLSELLMVRGMRLGINAAGEWTIAVDTEATTRRLVAQDGTEDGERTLLGVGERTGPALDDTIADAVIKYRLDAITDRYLFELRREVNADRGKDRVYEHHFLRAHESADRVVDYLGKRFTFGQEHVEITLGQSARQLAEGEILALLDPTIGYDTATDLEVFEVEKRLDAIRARCRSWSDAIYVYSAGTLPTDNVSGTETDFTRTFPTAPTTPTSAATGTRVAGDGKVSAFITLAFTNPASNFAHSRVRYRVNGTTPWMIGAIATALGATTATIEGLDPSQSYDYSVEAVNGYGLATASGTLSAQVAATDASIPTAPSAIAVSQSGGKVVEIRITASPPLDWGTVRLFRNTTNSSGTATEIARGKKLIFHDENVTYGTTYFYWAKVEDTSGNLSGFSPSSSHSITVARIVTNDVGTGQIDTDRLGTDAATSNKTSKSASALTAATTSTSYTDVPDDAAGIMSISVTTPGGVPILIIAMMSSEGTVGAATAGTAFGRLVRDSTALQTQEHSDYFDTADVRSQGMPFIYMESPAAGTYTYKLQYRSNGTVSHAIRARYIAAAVLKR